MTASETGREIPADELVERLRRRLDKWRYTGPDRKPWLNAPLAEIRAMDEMLARSEARIASLEAERARTVEACAAVAEGFGKPYTLHTHTGAMMFRACTENIARAIRSLASEKGGQGDG